MHEAGSVPLAFDATGLRDHNGRQAGWPRLLLLGHPVGHSLSPRLHGAALSDRGLPGEYRTIDVASAELASCLRDAARHRVDGINVTLPHKVAALSLCAESSDAAHRIGAANALVRRGTEWVGHNTDGPGLAMSLERALGRLPGEQLRSVAILGAGGAARAAVFAVRCRGARRVSLHARRPEAAEWARRDGIAIHSLDDPQLRESTLILQCTPLGIRPSDPSPISPALLSPHAFVMDLVYGAEPSRFLREAGRRGCRVSDGLPMLVAQAALSFELWFGPPSPLAIMAAAVGLRWDDPSSGEGP